MNFILKRMYENGKKHGPGSPGRKGGFPVMFMENDDGTLPDTLVEYNDIRFDNIGDEILYYDIIMPKDAGEGKPLPVAVYFHGGGLLFGTRKLSRPFRKEIALNGYIVYSIDYPLINKCDAITMFISACRGMAAVNDSLQKYGGDPGRVFILAESAGAFVSMFAAAAAASPGFREKYGLPDPKLSPEKLAFFSGMFYTEHVDPIGMMYKKDLYGSHLREKGFMKQLDPDNPDIISLLPPIFLTSSKADFLRSFTLRYEKALKKAGHPHKLVYYREDKQLTHAFVSMQPSLPQSRDTIQELLRWMSGQGEQTQ